LPHVDGTYRTIQSKFARGVEGQSMGGYGTLRFCFKYPETFGTALSVAPSIDRNLSDEPWGIGDTFGHNQEYFEEIGPWNLAKVNADRFNDSKNKLRLIVGDKDGLLNTDTNYHNFLNDLNINHEFFIVPGAGHNYAETLTNYGDEAFKFWKENLKN
jgi:enterochelin esterase-like enzyme